MDVPFAFTSLQARAKSTIYASQTSKSMDRPLAEGLRLEFTRLHGRRHVPAVAVDHAIAVRTFGCLPLKRDQSGLQI